LAPSTTNKRTDGKKNKNRVLRIDCDVRILFIVLVLVGIGASLVASSSSFFAGEEFSDHFALLRKHMFKIVVALLGLMLAKNIDYRVYRKVSPVILVIGVGMLAGLFVVDHTIRETSRWYFSSRLQMALQPAEVARLALVFFLAYWITRSGKDITDFKKGFLPAACAVALVVGLIAATPNYGSAAATTLIALIMLFLGGARLLHIGGFVAAGTALAALKLSRTPYVMDRFLSFLHPSHAVTDANWQVHQSLVGLGSGGIWGRGFGNSTQKLSWLPDSYTDFIFAVLGEEAGLIGTVVVSGLFLLLALRALKISRRCNDVFGEMLVVGIGASVFVYAVLNMYVATGLFPVTGLPLPFLSYGGSALVVNAVAVGVLLNVSCLNGTGKSTRRGLRAGPVRGMV
jgi:cell division protein FtsW